MHSLFNYQNTFIMNTVDYKQWEWYEEGDGVEFEYWKHIPTGKIYSVAIEIVRNFDDKHLSTIKYHNPPYVQHYE